MSRSSSHAIVLSLACAGVLLFTPGCLVGVDVGQDGMGGSGSTSSSTSTSTGDSSDAPAGMSCQGPSSFQCAWGQLGGPCGGSLPYKKDCDAGLICAGATADTEGTCVSPGVTLLSPGAACDSNTSVQMCPWSAPCTTGAYPPKLTGTCAANPHCTLDVSPPFVSAATITVDGDGPTQRYDFSCPFQYGYDLTGEANGSIIRSTANPSLVAINIDGCGSSSADLGLGSIDLGGLFSAPGALTNPQVMYLSPYVDGVPGAEYTSDNPNHPQPPGQVSITVLQAGENFVQGSYDAVLQDEEAINTKHITGTFAVCRLPDRMNP